MKVVLILAFAFAGICTSAEEVRREIIPGNDQGLIKLSSIKSRAGIEYYISNFKATYNNAFNYCIQSGRKLAIVKTDVQQADIVSGLIDISHIVQGNVWFNSYCSNGGWYWGDQSSVLYNQLPNGRTDCFDNNQGIMMFGTQTFQPILFTWAGEGKSEANYFICQNP